MASLSIQPWKLRLTTLVLWALAAASTVYWGLRLTALPHEHANTIIATAPTSEPLTADADAIARLLGGNQSPPKSTVSSSQSPATSRFVLKGILAGSSTQSGAALIAINGQPAKPYRIGAEIAPGLVLQSLSKRQARLGKSMQEAEILVLDIYQK